MYPPAVYSLTPFLEEFLINNDNMTEFDQIIGNTQQHGQNI